MTSEWLEVNGELLGAAERHISALDRGFALSDGVFETMRASGRVFRLEAHLARMRAAGSVLGMIVPRTDAEWAESVGRVLGASGMHEAVVRVTVSRGVPGERGLLPPADPRPTVVVQASPFHAMPWEKLAQGFRVVTSAVRRNEHSPTSRIKACSYLDNVLARMAAREAGADEALMLNMAGEIACCSSANVFMVESGRLLTPAVECGVLAGITRAVVRELAFELGTELVEGRPRPETLWRAEEAFLTNSVLGIVPITAVDGRSVGDGRPGAATIRLMERYEEMVRQETGSAMRR